MSTTTASAPLEPPVNILLEKPLLGYIDAELRKVHRLTRTRGDPDEVLYPCKNEYHGQWQNFLIIRAPKRMFWQDKVTKLLENYCQAAQATGTDHMHIIHK